MSPADKEMEMEMEMLESDKVNPDDYTATGEPKACADCNTTKTPLWRGGPLGPKSLCNACGIRYRKRRRVAMGLDPEAKRKPKRTHLLDAAKPAEAEPEAEAEASSTQEEEDKDKDKAKAKAKASSDKKTSNTKTKTKTHTLELHMVGFPKSKDSALKRRRMHRTKPSCFGEEERAAILLMALSSGVIYA